MLLPSPPSLYLDENLSPRLAEQLAFAADQGRTLVTINFRDFVALHEAYLTEGRSHFGIVFTTEERFGTGITQRVAHLLN